jgi:acetolactate synthase-1/2/3 large subunit
MGASGDGTEHIPRLVMQAIRAALSATRAGVAGSAVGCLMNQIDEDSVIIPDLVLSAHGARPDPADLDQALALLRKAERPVIVLGSEASRTARKTALSAFVAATGVPVFADYEGLSMLSGCPMLCGAGWCKTSILLPKPMPRQISC